MRGIATSTLMGAWPVIVPLYDWVIVMTWSALGAAVMMKSRSDSIVRSPSFCHVSVCPPVGSTALAGTPFDGNSARSFSERSVVSRLHVWPSAQSCIAVGGWLVSAGSTRAQPDRTSRTAGAIINTLARLLAIINPPVVRDTHEILRGHERKTGQRPLRPAKFMQLLVVDAVIVGYFVHQRDVNLIF